MDWKNTLLFTNLFPISFKKGDNLLFISFCIYKPISNFKKINDSNIIINDEEKYTKFLFKKGIKIPIFKIYFNFYCFYINIDKVLNFPVQNKVYLKYNNINIPIIYDVIDYKKGRERHGKIVNIGNTAIYFRQSIKNALYLTIRKTNITDKINKRILLLISYVLSKFSFNSKDILLYEKETNRYEESASIVFEKLVDKGFKNAYFVINKDSKQINLIKKKYKKNIIFAHTFKHYYKFFKCKTFISSESLQHVLELRVANKYVGNKLKNKKFKYVFLQHGVMYMISIDSNNRGFFRKGESMPDDSKVVVSSKKEAQHFIDRGGFDINDLYITGLPKFDRSKLDKNADKIVIMPTWRPWEYNEIRNNYKESGYYKMINEIIASIPKEIKENIVVLPHPLVKDFLEKTDLDKYVPQIVTYDLILKNTKILITDYSSIAYDSFYRGSNIIFWWKEKEKCLKKYNGELMLKSNEAFGDICYNKKELSQSVLSNYRNKQKKDYIIKFKKIVEFNDNKNTDRLINKLIEDKIIK